MLSEKGYFYDILHLQLFFRVGLLIVPKQTVTKNGLLFILIQPNLYVKYNCKSILRFFFTKHVSLDFWKLKLVVTLKLGVLDNITIILELPM